RQASCSCTNGFFCSSRRRHTSSKRDWSSDVCSSDLVGSRSWRPTVVDGLYAYALTRDDIAERVSATGIHGAEVTAVAANGLAAIVSAVDLDEFGEGGLRHHLDDLDWVRDVAVAHDEDRKSDVK